MRSLTWILNYYLHWTIIFVNFLIQVIFLVEFLRNELKSFHSVDIRRKQYYQVDMLSNTQVIKVDVLT